MRKRSFEQPRGSRLPDASPVEDLPKSESKPQAFKLVNLGCPKNLVDGEGMAQLLKGSGYLEEESARRADVLIVNTCTFIKTAEDESARQLRSFAAKKRPGQLLVLAGCMAARHGQSLKDDFPAVDGILGTLRWNEIAELVGELRKGNPSYWLGESQTTTSPHRVASGYSAYLKISDGCDVGCAFCTIPSFKGRHRSKPVERIITEAQELIDSGAREIILIGQDLTDYGRDLGQKDGLANLAKNLCAEVDLGWLRLMYAFPGRLTPRLLETIASEPKIAKYIDIPLQHASREMLARMRRPRHDVRQVIGEIRAVIPNVAIRSAFIAGYPGETEAEFEELLSFLADTRLDRVGLFKYSQEEGTLAATLPDQIDESVKEERFDRAMRLQMGISLARNQELIGRTLEVLVEAEVIEGKAEAGFAAVGRSQRDAPEVDGLVLIRDRVKPGQFRQITVTDALEYDVIGRLASS